MAESFQRDSDMFKIPFLRALLSANIDATFKKKYGVVYTKSQGQPIFIEFMRKCLRSIVEIPSGGRWQDTIAGKLITATGPAQEDVFNSLKILCEQRMERFISAATDQDQCRYVGIVNTTSGCKYDLKDTFPIINNGAVNSSRDLWTNKTWCNNCWLCGLSVGESGYPYTKQCEHILPYLTGSILLGTATNNTLVLNQDTKREYGQSHAVCNQFKNQGEFIKFDPLTITFTPDIDQICNYIEELTGIKLNKKGEAIWKSDIVSTKTIDSFTQIFEKKKIGGLAGPAQRTQLAQDMYKTITNVINTLCTTSLSRENISGEFMAKLLYTAILNFLVDSQARAALILSKGAIIDFGSTLNEYHRKLFPAGPSSVWSPKPFTPEEVVGLITAYRSPFTTKKITERLKNYINDDKVPKPKKYIILAKTLYDNFRAMIPTNSFGSPPRRVRAPDQKDRDKISKTIQKQTLKKLQSDIIDNVLKEDKELLPYCKLLEQREFKDNLSIIIDELGNITYGDLYSKLTYTTDGQNYDYDEKFTIQNGKIILPSFVYTIYENFDRMDDRGLDNFLGIINKFFPLPPSPMAPVYLKIFSAYIYGLSVINLLNYDLDLAKKTFETHALSNQFGKKSRNLKSMSEIELKNKLKSVGILVTKKFNEKRLPLTRKQLEQKAREFTKLQLKAKIKNIKITYISRDGIRKYKSYKRLLSDLEKINKFGTPRQSERLRLRRKEAYDQAMNIERATAFRYNERLIQQQLQAEQAAAELREREMLERARAIERENRRCRAMGSDENRGIRGYIYNPFTSDCLPDYYNSRPPSAAGPAPSVTDTGPPPITRMNVAATPASQQFGRGLIKAFKPMIKSISKDFKEEIKKNAKEEAQKEARKKALELKKRALIEAKTKMYNKNNVKVVKDKQNNTIITASRMG
jgi:hypothetical protein